MKTVLMCHSPILIPEIAGKRLREVEASALAMATLARRIVSQEPDGIIIVTPHMPRFQTAFGLHGEKILKGDFGDYGYQELKIEVQGAPSIVYDLQNKAARHDLQLNICDEMPLDRGAMVPLYFLNKQNWQGPVAVLGFPLNSNLSQCVRLGEAIRETINERGENWTLIVSGEMSHRLKPESPGGYHERASEFDRWIFESIEAGDLPRALEVDPGLRQIACEDVLNSLAIAFGVLGKGDHDYEPISYEYPYGVGYLVADLDVNGQNPTVHSGD